MINGNLLIYSTHALYNSKTSLKWSKAQYSMLTKYRWQSFCSPSPGAIWGKQPVDFDQWEIEVTFKVTGRGRVGADGLVSPDYVDYTV